MARAECEVDFRNTTVLDSHRLAEAIQQAVAGWRIGSLTVRVRYSRGADFSGTCYYKSRRIFVNVGRHLKFPYALRTNLARARSHGRMWSRQVFVLDLRDGLELAVFIFLHELFHLLVKVARRNTRQKEGMCDRFAARTLVDRWGVAVRTEQGQAVPRDDWDFQDLEGFVAAARRKPRGAVVIAKAARRPQAATEAPTRQLTLFPL